MGYVGSTVCWSILFGNTMNMQKSSLDFGGQSHKIQIVQEFYLSDQWSAIISCAGVLFERSDLITD